MAAGDLAGETKSCRFRLGDSLRQHRGAARFIGHFGAARLPSGRLFRRAGCRKAKVQSPCFSALGRWPLAIRRNGKAQNLGAPLASRFLDFPR